MLLRHCNSRVCGAAVAGWALPLPPAWAPVGPAAAVPGSARFPSQLCSQGAQAHAMLVHGGPHPWG